MTTEVLYILGILAVVAGWRAMKRVRDHRREARLTDNMLRDIETRGTVEVDDPLDHEEIARQEREFFEETWDEPEEF